jgi:chromosome segregation ATPase
MSSRLLLIVGVVAAIVVAAGAAYSVSFLYYQPQIDGYKEQVAGLEAKLSEAGNRTQGLEAELSRQTELYQQASNRLNNISSKSERLEVDRVFLAKMFKQINTTTTSFDDELTLWQDVIPEAKQFDPEILPMIDNLLKDYKLHFEWLDSIKNRQMTPSEATSELNKGYALTWQINEDLRKFDAYWVGRIEQDIKETISPLQPQ